MNRSYRDFRRVFFASTGYSPAAGAYSAFFFVSIIKYVGLTLQLDQDRYFIFLHKRALKFKPLLIIAATNSNEPHMNDEPPKICADKNLPSSL